MDIMAVAAASMDMRAGQTQQAVNIAMLKKTMDTQNSQGAALVQDIKELPNPARLLDVKI
ncbi:MAG: YjfB family protein [Oscillospiraceae bacterium]